jgi:hypothetical protein
LAAEKNRPFGMHQSSLSFAFLGSGASAAVFAAAVVSMAARMSATRASGF